MFLEHSSVNEAMPKFDDFNTNILCQSKIWGYKINRATRIIFRHFRENTLTHEIIANILNFVKTDATIIQMFGGANTFIRVQHTLRKKP